MEIVRWFFISYFGDVLTPKTAFWSASLGPWPSRSLNVMHYESENSSVSGMLYLTIIYILIQILI